MKKVLFNTWQGAFFNPGGGEIQLLHSKEKLEALGYEIEMFNQWSPQKDFDIYHQFSIELGTETVLKAYKSLGKKIVLSPIMWNLFPKDSLRWYLTKNMFELADVIMTNSKAETFRLSKEFNLPHEKFHETRNSVSDDYLTLSTTRNFRREFSIKGDFVLSVANIDDRKNTKMLVEACIELDKQLVLIGKIRDQDYLQTFKATFDRVKFIGPIYDTELLKSAYQQATVFALPSLCETPGISALEAASQGTQIIITEVGATKEYFREFAEYCNPYSTSDLKNLLNKAFYNKSGKNRPLSEYIRTNFTWSHTAKDISNGYARFDKASDM